MRAVEAFLSLGSILGMETGKRYRKNPRIDVVKTLILFFVERVFDYHESGHLFWIGIIHSDGACATRHDLADSLNVFPVSDSCSGLVCGSHSVHFQYGLLFPCQPKCV